MSQECKLREELVLHGKSLFERGYGCGSSGNLSVRLDDGFLITPTNSCMGRLDPARISMLDSNGNHLAGDKPSKEAFLHLAMYQERPDDKAITHLHSTYSVAVSCLAGIDPANVLPPITAYYVMRIGCCPLIPYFPPGDKALAEAVRDKAEKHKAVLLANHGPVICGKSVEASVYSAEEFEETAKLYFLLHGQETRFLSPQQEKEINLRFPS